MLHHCMLPHPSHGDNNWLGVGDGLGQFWVPGREHTPDWRIFQQALGQGMVSTEPS